RRDRGRWGLMAKLAGQLFARLALDYFDHPKIMQLSDAAIVAHLEMIAYSRRYGTDGAIPMRFAMRFATEVLDELASNDPDRPSITRNPDGTVTIYGYADMQETSEQVSARRQARAEAGRAGAAARWQAHGKTDGKSHGKTDGKRDGKKMAETETETELSSAIPDRRPDVDSLCSRLADHIEANGSKRPTIGKAWHDAARLLLDRDERPVVEAERLIDWCQQDEFWRSNILSMPKFRQQYDQLKLKAGPAAKPRPDFGLQEWMNYA
ncbi:MAG: hypothetical protein ACTHZD_16130, partial [Micrococcaceae bacterium]